MIRWLKSLLSRPRPAPSVLPTPPAWQPPEASAEERAIVIAFLKRPDRKPRREAVIGALNDRLDRLLLPQGFVRDGKGWMREMPAGRSMVSVKRFRGGVDATLEIEFRPKPGTKPARVYAGLLNTQLGNFVQMSERTFVRNGSIDYAFADHDLTVLDFPLAVLRDRALPWVLDHGTGQYPDKQAYRERPLQAGQA